MIKLVGILFIVGAASACGFECSSMLTRRVRSLEAFVRLFDALAGRISAFSTPINEFFASYSDETLEACGFLSRIGNGFCEAVNECSRALCLEDDDIKLLVAFGDGLGAMSASEEAKRCLYYKDECDKSAAAARAELPVKTRLLKSAGVMCGVLAAVLVL